MKRLLPFVCVVVVVDTIFYTALTPLLPHLKDSYDLSKSAAGLLVASYGIGVLLGAIPAGVVATKFGARNGVLAGLVLVTVASVAFALAGSYELLVATRLAQGFGSSLTWAAALAWLALETPRERRGTALGTAMGAAVFGALLGPVVGAAASELGQRVTFCVVAGLTAALGVVALRFASSPPEPQPIRLVWGALRDREYLLGMWLMTVPALLFGALNVLAPLALDDRGFSAVAIGAVWIGAAAIETVVSPLLGRASDRYGTVLPIRAALFASCVVSLALAATEWPPLLVPLLFAAAIAFGAFYAPALTMISHSAESIGLAQGLSFGVMNASWAIGNAIGPAAGGGLADATSDAVTYLAGASLCFVTLVAVAPRVGTLRRTQAGSRRASRSAEAK